MQLLRYVAFVSLNCRFCIASRRSAFIRSARNRPVSPVPLQRSAYTLESNDRGALRPPKLGGTQAEKVPHNLIRLVPA